MSNRSRPGLVSPGVGPCRPAERTPPRDQREWAIFARASWAFSFDNITDIPPWLSNALCKGVTGDAVLQRVLHSDEDIGVYSFQRTESDLKLMQGLR